MPTAGSSSPGMDPQAFEQEVRRVAGLLYPDTYGGATVASGRERDGVFVTEDTVMILEATLSREKAKAEIDGKKLKTLAGQLARKYPFHAIKAFFITGNDPTAAQLDAIRKIGQPVVAMSYAKFRARLIDSNSYLSARSDHAFGSARDPETNDVRLKESEYVTLDFVDVLDRRMQYNLPALVDAMDVGQRVVLLGDYGAGKSMTLRQVYLDFAKKHRRGGSAKFCIHINLNEHQGQTEPAEALIRHASLIGFPQPHQLVRAWRSGDAHIILDGFDEVFVPGWTTTSRTLAEVRKRSVALIAQFVTETPSASGILIAGREHFFDNINELKSAFGISPHALIVSATDFTEEQVEHYLRQRRWRSALPDWLPRRPLIVGYLAARKLFDVVDELSTSDPGIGWHRLVAELADREARMGIDENTVREIVERLATLARKSSGGLGPLSFEDLVTVFRDLRGYLPDEGAYSVLQRLPGLRVNDNQINSRLFVDDALVDACRAGDVYRWIKYHEEKRVIDAMYGWQNLLGSVGLAVLKYRLEEDRLTVRAVQSALERVHSGPELDGMRTDLVRHLFQIGSEPMKPLMISDQHIPTIYIAETSNASGVTFSECIIDVLDLSDVEAAERLPTLRGCVVTLVEGVAGLDELAAGKFADSDIGGFSESAENVSAILRLDLPDYTRVTLTVLRKIFVQSGHSRKESALYRGLLTNKQKDLIPLVLKNLEKKGAIRKNRRRDATLWAPNLGMYRRVARILDTPTTSKDDLIIT